MGKSPIIDLESGNSAGGNSSLATNGALDFLSKDIKIFVQDEESAHDRNEVLLPASVIQDGNLVMANVYGDGLQDEEDDDSAAYFDDYGTGDGVRNDCGSIYPDDLITLTHLHKPSVVYCLRKRYSYDKSYTATGQILIALNPFKNCKDLWDTRITFRPKCELSRRRILSWVQVCSNVSI